MQKTDFIFSTKQLRQAKINSRLAAKDRAPVSMSRIEHFYCDCGKEIPEIKTFCSRCEQKVREHNAFLTYWQKRKAAKKALNSLKYGGHGN